MEWLWPLFEPYLRKQFERTGAESLTISLWATEQLIETFADDLVLILDQLSGGIPHQG